VLVAQSWGQIIYKQGTPPGLFKRETHPGSTLSSSARQPAARMLPAIDRIALAREDAQNDARKDAPYRFAVPHAVTWSPDNSGMWSDLADGQRLWRMEIQSPGAVTLNVIFDRFRLEPGAEVYLYSASGAHVLGPLTHLNNLPDGNLATLPIDGDRMVVEYLVPKGAEGGELSIGQVAHGYRGFGDGVFGSSGSCNNNASCPEWKDWGCHTRSVVLALQDGSTWCTGTLLNNTSQDGRPLILTANHCQPQNGANWVYIFNWISPTCSPSTNAPRNQTVSGGKLLVRNDASDFGLLEMSSKPPASYEAYYTGWDASGRTPQRQVGIHHPAGDIMKISLDTDPARKSGNFWSVAWNDGVTQPGSSGSGLWDENQRLIGQLLGGGSSCQTPTAGDEYGMLSVSWGLGASKYLDPGYTGKKVMDGMGAGKCGGISINASFSPDAPKSCDGSVKFADQSNNANQWSWSFGDGATSTERNPTHNYAAVGDYTVKLVVKGDSGRADTAESKVRVGLLRNYPVTGDTACMGETAQVSAMTPAGTSVSWYAQATGGTSLATGQSFAIPAVTGPMSYFMQVSENQAIRRVGPASNSVGGGGFYENFDHGLLFDAHASMVLKSVKVFAGAAGSRTIEVRKGRDGAVVATVTRDVPQGESRVNLDFSLPAGSYFIKVANGTLLNLYRNNAGPTYPYSHSGLVTITGSSADQPGYYYFFYDWEVQEQSCSSERIPVALKINPNCATGITKAGESGFSLKPQAGRGQFLVMAPGAGELRIHHSSGRLLQVASIRPGANRLDLRGFSPGLYLAAFGGQSPRWLRVGF
jgi:PKD repeat protein